ncbi:monofunctional biosynthetic peptidoglycan transglycosylase [Humidesulfovibrio mexicanus]|uniref:Biosynthetic peptidoglycan transglycosylase n=1 Tax=Humidesulfovibrio mexicanus TaxID=147047 RepID=A0A238ZW94_9BACT|nr:monofunctional biosynthetic peptidoglycan transglycosylase [Humidesulfovibrio mexicanus]SNR87402.1 monofunctional biosynthetic peptidoglycan transglycosylase [Humidesulfovibrio mexicanus]
MRKPILTVAGLALLAALAYLASFFVYPDVGALAKKNPGKTAFMEWREAQWAEKGEKKKITQRWVPLSRVSPLLVKAVLIGEDDKFYHHEGFDYEALEQAFEKNLKEGRFAAGASTISQQLTKNLFLSPEKSLTRKAKEAILTWRMERTLSKRRILELYVNVAEWGDGIFGVEAASRHYFQKPASQLTSMEAARLAAVLPNPIRFNPVGSQRYVTFRANLIHSIMVRRGIAVAGFQEVMEGKDEPAEPAEPLGPGEPHNATGPGEPAGASVGSEGNRGDAPAAPDAVAAPPSATGQLPAGPPTTP